MSDAENDDKTQVLSRPPEVPADAPPGRLRCVDTSVLKDGTGAEIVLEGRLITVGRGQENDVALNAHGISRFHARIVATGGAWQVEDLGSTNGTRVNNSRVEGNCTLNDGDTVAFGRVCYKYSIQDRPDLAATGTQDIDLGSGEQTVIMRPGAARASKPPPAPAAAPAAAAASRPAAAASPKRSAADTTPRAKAAPAAKSGSNTGLWVVVVVVAAGIAVGAAFALGLI